MAPLPQSRLGTSVRAFAKCCNYADPSQPERELLELVESMDRERITDDATNRGIRWNWNPPLSSHCGGVFELLIKVAKETLKAIVGNARLNDDELQTAFKK